MLVKAVSWGIGIIIPVAVVEKMMELMLFGENGSQTSSSSGSLHLDAFAMVSIVDPFFGGIGFVVLIYFYIKMHKRA